MTSCSAVSETRLVSEINHNCTMALWGLLCDVTTRLVSTDNCSLSHAWVHKPGSTVVFRPHLLVCIGVPLLEEVQQHQRLILQPAAEDMA
jgi:hypothetical protein